MKLKMIMEKGTQEMAEGYILTRKSGRRKEKARPKWQGARKAAWQGERTQKARAEKKVGGKWKSGFIADTCDFDLSSIWRASESSTSFLARARRTL